MFTIGLRTARKKAIAGRQPMGMRVQQVIVPIAWCAMVPGSDFLMTCAPCFAVGSRLLTGSSVTVSLLSGRIKT